MYRWRVCVRFAGQIISGTMESADGLTAFQCAFSARVSPKSHASRVVRNDLVLGNEQEEDPDHRQIFLDGKFFGIKKGKISILEHLLAVLCAELSKDGHVKTLQILSVTTASAEHPRDWCQMTKHANPESQESIRCELLYVLCMRIILLRSARSHACHVAFTSKIQLNLLDTGTHPDAL